VSDAATNRLESRFDRGQSLGAPTKQPSAEIAQADPVRALGDQGGGAEADLDAGLEGEGVAGRAVLLEAGGLAQGADGHAAQFRPPQPAPPSGEPRIQPRIRSPKTGAVFQLPRAAALLTTTRHAAVSTGINLAKAHASVRRYSG
jgi:hypothetical protein